MEKEYRSLTELKATKSDNEYIIEGYITQYNKRSKFMGFYEEIKPGAFDRSLNSRSYIPALFDHDGGKILGSTRSGSLTLTSDDVGLKYELRINPNVSYAKDIYELVKAGDIDGCSFSFGSKDDEWTIQPDGTDLRSLKDVELYEVSITPYPAYNDTSASCRSYNEFKKTTKAEEQKELKIKLLELELEL